MKLVSIATRDEIEQHLIRLGGGNHTDNMAQCKLFSTYRLVDLTEEEFLGIVFPEMDSTRELIVMAGSRCLGRVARAAINYQGQYLKPNWDLNSIIQKTRTLITSGQSTSINQSPLLLRTSRGSEQSHGEWYLQDGSHRALGYACCLMEGDIAYSTRQAYVIS